MPAENVTVTATFKKAAPIKINLDQVSISLDSFNRNWNVSFANADGYVEDITEVKVNGETWQKKQAMQVSYMVVSITKIHLIINCCLLRQISVPAMMQLF